MEVSVKPYTGQFVLALRYYRQQLWVKKKVVLLILLLLLLSCGLFAFCAEGTWRDAEGMTALVMSQIDDICDKKSVTIRLY